MDMLLVTEGRSILLPSDRVGCASSRRDEVARYFSPGGEESVGKKVAGGGWNGEKIMDARPCRSREKEKLRRSTSALSGPSVIEASQPPRASGASVLPFNTSTWPAVTVISRSKSHTVSPTVDANH